jgi:glyoxylase-like metal-dependent hydrolase (beta-lactamase superfamily II)
VVLATIPAGTAIGQASSMRRTQLAEGVYQFSDTTPGSPNMVVVVNDSDVTIFDTDLRPSRTRLVLEEIRSLTPKPVRTVINSHWHPDHWSGNAVYSAAYPAVQFVATAESRRIMAAVAPSWPAIYAGNLERRRVSLMEAVRTGKRADGSAFTAEQRKAREASNDAYAVFADEMRQVVRVLPTLTFNDSLTLYSGSREIRLRQLDGDAVGSAVAYLPRENVVLAGDLLVSPVTWTTNSFRIAPWIASLKAVRTLDPAVIVPGHGPAFRDTQYLTLVIELFEAAVSQVNQALARGLVTSAEVQTAVNLEPFRERFTRGKRARRRLHRDGGVVGREGLSRGAGRDGVPTLAVIPSVGPRPFSGCHSERRAKPEGEESQSSR